MTDDRKRAAALIGILFLCLVVAAMLWLAWLAGTSDYVVLPDSESVEQLNFSWRVVFLFIKLGTAVNTIFAVLLTVISAVAIAVTETYKRLPAILAISLLCLAGIAAAVLVLTLVDEEALNQIRFGGNSEMDTVEVGNRLRGVIAPVIGWLSALLAGQLGISTIAPNGVLRRLVDQ